MILRTIDKKEYKIIASLHLNAFSDFFLTSLGKSFLCTYYKASLRSSESLSICAIGNEGHIQGFGIGCVKSRGYHKRLLFNNLPGFIFQGFILLFRPRSIFRLLKNLEKISNNNDDGNYAELLSIGVSPSLKGLGLGKNLLSSFEDEARKRGCKKIALTTDFFNNQNVLSFYEKSGYEIFSEFTTYPNRRMYKLIKDISNH